jgi:hypothetical protein
VRAAGHDVDISALCPQISSHVAPAEAGAYHVVKACTMIVGLRGKA